MPTILTHPAVPIALGPWLRGSGRQLIVAGAIASVLPDLDVIGFAFGIHYEDFLGHRGFMHSIVFAVLVAVVLAVATHRSDVPFQRRFAFLAICGGSHGILDAATDGGLGIALFSPLDLERYFLPWRPLRVSPIGAGFISTRGAETLISELIWVWTPSVLVFAAGLLIRHRRASGPVQTLQGEFHDKNEGS